MEKDFQPIIDEALCEIPRNMVARDFIHFAPIGEKEHQEEILAHLKKDAHYHTGNNRVHIGVGGGFNFSIAAQTRSQKILLLDMNQNQTLFWQAIIKLLQECDSAETFCDRFKETAEFYQFREEAHSYNAYLDAADWLMSEESYTYLHQLACKGSIAAATLDIVNDKDAAIALGKALKEQNLIADTCYWSNIGNFFQPYAVDTDENPIASTKIGTKHFDHFVGNEGDVFNTTGGGLCYMGMPFYQKTMKDHYIFHWDGTETEDKKLPFFEKMLRNISIIGDDEHSMHMLTSTDRHPPLIVTDGPPRNLARIAQLREQRGITT